VAGQDPALGKRVFLLKIVAGRDLNPRNADEAIVAYQSARALHLQVGDRFPLLLPPPLEALLTQFHSRTPRAMRVVGTYITPNEFPPSTTQTDFHFTAALYRLLPENPTPSI